MGCDIHMAVEVRRNGKWERVLPPESAWDPWLVVNGWMDDARQSWYDGRNYTLFGVLAGVRNYDVDPISKPRGFPPDPGDEVAKMIADDGLESWWLGDHSHTWLTLDEVLAYDWDQRLPNGDTLRECSDDFMTRTVPALQNLDPDPRNVRLVFGFDS